MWTKTYSELARLDDYYERFEFLKIGGQVGDQTFGFERYLNQQFYRSSTWRRVRDVVIARDNGCDMGVEGYDVHRPDRIIVHHMNPMTPADIVNENPDIFNPEYLISVSNNTHQAIHYGDASLLPQPWVERRPGDTRPEAPRPWLFK